MTDKKELAALSRVGEINAHHREFLKSANESIQHAYHAGQILCEIKKFTKHGNWGEFVEKLDFSERSAQSYMKLHKDLGKLPKAQNLALLKNADSVNHLQKLLDPPGVKKAKKKPEQKNSKAVIDEDNPCPNCQSVYWLFRSDGHVCDNCKHPYGEPVGDPDEKDKDDDEPGDLEMEKGSASHEKEYKKARTAMGIVIRFLARMKVEGAETHTDALMKLIG